MRSIQEENLPQRHAPALLAGLLGGAIALGAARTAQAEPARQFALEYRPNATCPSESELVTEIERRAPQATRVASAPGDLEIFVAIAERGERVLARVVVRGPEGETERAVDGANCAEVTRAVALIVVLSLDATTQEPSDVDRGATAMNADAPVSAKPMRSAPRAELERARVARTARDTASGEPAARRWWLGFGALAAVSSGISQDAALMEGVFVAAGQNSDSWIRPSFRLAGLRATDSVATSAGIADLSFLALRASGCPLTFGQHAYAELCVTFDYGRLRGQGRATLDPRERVATWVAPGAAIHGGVIVKELLVFSAELGLVAPLLQDKFRFRPDVIAHHIPAAAAHAALSLGVRL